MQKQYYRHPSADQQRPRPMRPFQHQMQQRPPFHAMQQQQFGRSQSQQNLYRFYNQKKFPMNQMNQIQYKSQQNMNRLTNQLQMNFKRKTISPDNMQDRGLFVNSMKKLSMKTKKIDGRSKEAKMLKQIPFIGPLWKNGKKQGPRYIKKNKGERKPPPPRDPNTGRFLRRGEPIPDKVERPIKEPSTYKRKPKTERKTNPKPSTEEAKANFVKVELQKEEEIEELKGCMPEDFQKQFFDDKLEPNIMTEYDAIGFVAENALVQFNIPKLTKLLIETHLKELHKKWPENYPLRVTQFCAEKHLQYAVKNVVWDIKTGAVLKIAENFEITNGVHGFDTLTHAQIVEMYGSPPIFNKLKWPEKAVSLENEDEAYWVFTNQFEVCLLPIVCWIVRLTKGQIVKGKSHLQFAFDLKQVHYSQMVNKSPNGEVVPIKEFGQVYPVIFTDPRNYILRRDTMRQPLAQLRISERMLFLISDFGAEFLDLIMKKTLGKDWQHFFDFVCADAQKPLFYKSEAPFWLYEPDLKNHQGQKIVSAEAIRGYLWPTQKKIMLQGNAGITNGYLKKYTANSIRRPKTLIFGNDCFNDFRAVNHYHVEKGKHFPILDLSTFESMAVIPEIYQLDSKTAEKEGLIPYESEIWGRSQFHCEIYRKYGQEEYRKLEIKKNFFYDDTALVCRYALKNCKDLPLLLKSFKVKFVKDIYPKNGVRQNSLNPKPAEVESDEEQPTKKLKEEDKTKDVNNDKEYYNAEHEYSELLKRALNDPDSVPFQENSMNLIDQDWTQRLKKANIEKEDQKIIAKLLQSNSGLMKVFQTKRAEDMREKLVQSLADTLNNDDTIRQAAEKIVKDAEILPGYLPLLLQIAIDEKCQDTVQLAAAVQLGTLVFFNWEFKDKDQLKQFMSNKALQDYSKDVKFLVIPDSDKNYLKDHLIDALHKTNILLVQKQFARAISKIAFFDYPDQWKSLLETITNYLKSSDPYKINTGLQCLESLVQKYQFETTEEHRNGLHGIIYSVLPSLANIINNQVKSGRLENDLVIENLRLICSVFYISNQVAIIPYFRNLKSLNEFLEFFKVILEIQVPENLASELQDADEIEKRDQHVLWLLKEQAAQLLYHFVTGYGWADFAMKMWDAEQVVQIDKKPEYGDWDEKWSEEVLTQYSDRLLKTFFKILHASKTSFIGTKTLSFGLKFIAQVCSKKSTMDKIRPYINTEFYETVISIMMVKHSDVILFEENPVEYENRKQDYDQNFLNPRQCMIEVLRLLCSQYKTEGNSPDFLQPFIKFLFTNMQEYKERKEANENPDWRIKEALLAALGYLSDEIEDYTDVQQGMVEQFETHVNMELKSKFSPLRTCACWIYRKFDFLNFTENLTTVTQDLFENIFHESLPIKLQACISLGQIAFENISVQKSLEQNLHKILEGFLITMEQIESQELGNSLSMIVGAYREIMPQHAMYFIEKLVNHYNILTNTADQNGEKRAIAAAGCIRAIVRIIEAVSQDIKLVAELRKLVIPVIRHALLENYEFCFDDAATAFGILAYYESEGRVQLHYKFWNLFLKVLDVVGGNEKQLEGGPAIQYLNQTVILCQIFIGRDTKTLRGTMYRSSMTYVERVCKFVGKVLNLHMKNDFEGKVMVGISGLKIIISLLENVDCREVLESLVISTITEITQIKHWTPPQAFISMTLQTLSMCFYNNALITFRVLVASKDIEEIFRIWLNNMEKFTTEIEIRRIIFGLSTMLSIGSPKIFPSPVQDRLNNLGSSLLKLAQKSEGSRRAELAINKEKLQYKGKYSQTSENDPTQVSFQSTQEESDMDDVEKDAQKAIADPILYESKLDKTDELLFFTDQVNQILEREPDTFHKLFYSQQQCVLEELIDGFKPLIEEERKVKMQMEKQQQN